MRLWIDASVATDLPVFGMSLVERHLRAAAKSGLKLASVCVDVGAGASPSLPDLSYLAAVEVSSGEGSVARRLSKFMARGGGPTIVLDANSVVDPRLFEYAAGRDAGFVARDRGLAFVVLDSGRHAALPEASSVAALAEALLAEGAIAEIGQDEFPAFIRSLRRTLPFFILPVANERERDVAERFMFEANYKGSTDFFTKHVYPVIVWNLVRPLARLRVHPNWVTGLNVVLGIAAVPAFAAGEYLAGFLCAYAMSVLDSVDGKLARLTFTDSKLGTLLDHGLDLIHPPFWYLAWAWAVAGGRVDAPVMAAAALLVVVYILDRLCLKAYSVNFRRGLHAHAPIDGKVRTFIARRNINLPLFTLGIVFGLGEEAFLLIVAWQLATLVWHFCRVGWILLLEPDGAAAAAGRA